MTSSGGIPPERASTVYAAAVTPFSSISTMAVWSAEERNMPSAAVRGLKSALSASSTSVAPTAASTFFRSVLPDTENLGTEIDHGKSPAFLLFCRFIYVGFSCQHFIDLRIGSQCTDIGAFIRKKEVHKAAVLQGKTNSRILFSVIDGLGITAVHHLHGLVSLFSVEDLFFCFICVNSFSGCFIIDRRGKHQNGLGIKLHAVNIVFKKTAGVIVDPGLQSFKHFR